MGEVYVKVTDDEVSAEPIELPLESDGTIFLSSITAQFPGACGLKYRNPETQTLRGLRLVDGVMFLPTSQEFWQDLLYIAVFPNKRKMNDTDTESQSRVQSKRPMQKCSDLIVLGLPWELNETQLEKYFSKYGELVMTQIKRDENKKSKGYGFIRFSTFEAQKAACRERHNIQDRWCEVKIPHSVASSHNNTASPKIFVGRVTEKLTTDDLNEYFSQYGPVHDVYIPTPFRAFAFVTFEDPETAESLIGDDHVIKGVSVHISHPEPKRKRPDQQDSNNAPGYHSNTGPGYHNNTGPGYHSGGNSNYGNNSYGNNSNFGNSGNYGNNGGYGNNRGRNNYSNNVGYQRQHHGYDRGGSYGNNYHGNNGPPNSNGFNMNPAMLAAAMNQWMNGMASMNHHGNK